MKIQAVSNSISFQKKLAATAGIVRNGKIEPCKIYSLSKTDDRDYFHKLEEGSDWKESYFIDFFHRRINEKHDKGTIFVMEDSENKCLGAIDLVSKKRLYTNVRLLETCPEYAYQTKNNSQRDVKYVGETLLAFATKIARNNLCKKVQVPIATINSVKFYLYNCGFKKDSLNPNNEKKKYSYSLSKDKFNAFIANNAIHTKTIIEVINDDE